MLKKKKEIEAWLNQYNIKNYELIKDKEYGYIVNIYADLFLYLIEDIKVKFNIIDGMIYYRTEQKKEKGFPNKQNNNNNYYGNYLLSENEKYLSDKNNVINKI